MIRDPNAQWFASVSYVPWGSNDNAGTHTGSIAGSDIGAFAVAASVDFSALGMVNNPVWVAVAGRAMRRRLD